MITKSNLEYMQKFTNNMIILKQKILFDKEFRIFHSCPCRFKVFERYFDALNFTFVDILEQINERKVNELIIKKNFTKNFYLWLINNNVSIKYVSFVKTVFSPIHYYFLNYIRKTLQNYFSGILTFDDIMFKITDIFEIVSEINLNNLANFNIKCFNLDDSIITKFVPYENEIQSKSFCSLDNVVCDNCQIIDIDGCDFCRSVEQENLHFIIQPEYLYLASKLLKSLYAIKKYHKEHNQIMIILDFKKISPRNFRCNKEFYQFMYYIYKEFENRKIINLSNDLFALFNKKFNNNILFTSFIKQGVFNENSVPISA